MQIKELTIKNNQLDLILVDCLSCAIGENDKIAIIGNEGVGKSTLLKVLKGNILNHISFTGHIIRPSIIGHLEQDITTVWGEYTLEEYIKESTNPLYLNDIYPLASKFELNYVELRNRLINSFSGGEKVKIGLIKVLLNTPDILILDEPSNDIDLATLIILENILIDTNIPILFVSHDQRLLENLSNGIIHLQYSTKKNKTLTFFSRMNYKKYKETYIKKFASDMMVARKQRSDYDKKMAKFKQIFNKVAHQQNVTKNDYVGQLLKKKMKNLKSQEKSFLKQKEKFVEIPEKASPMNLFFEVKDKKINQQKILVDLNIKNFKLKNNKTIDEIKLSVKALDKIVIIGKNGIGKTTLLKYIFQNATNQGLRVGYVSQNYSEVLEQDLDAVSFIMKKQDKYPEFRIRQILGALGFKKDETFRPIERLSEGTKLKVILLLLVCQDFELLLLDEPTRNLSPINQDELYELFSSFRGAIIAITHDRAFIEASFDHVYEMTEQGLYEL